MNKSDRARIKATAQSIMKMYQDIKEAHANDHWTQHQMSQGYRDSLEAMKRNNLISDYNLESGLIWEALS